VSSSKLSKVALIGYLGVTVDENSNFRELIEDNEEFRHI
jgi:hypothetical protein